MAGQCQLSFSHWKELETKLYCYSDKWFYMPEWHLFFCWRYLCKITLKSGQGSNWEPAESSKTLWSLTIYFVFFFLSTLDFFLLSHLNGCFSEASWIVVEFMVMPISLRAFVPQLEHRTQFLLPTKIFVRQWEWSLVLLQWTVVLNTKVISWILGRR